MNARIVIAGIALALGSAEMGRQVITGLHSQCAFAIDILTQQQLQEPGRNLSQCC